MQFLLSRYAMPAAASTEKRTSCFVFNSSFFFLRKDRKSPPGGTQKGEEVKAKEFTSRFTSLSSVNMSPYQNQYSKLALVPILSSGISTDTGNSGNCCFCFLCFTFALWLCTFSTFFPLPTWNQLHDNVDGLPLRTHTNELHDVWVVVLFQDPAERQRDT